MGGSRAKIDATVRVVLPGKTPARSANALNPPNRVHHESELGVLSKRNLTRTHHRLRSLGRPGVHPRLFHESFSLELPHLCRLGMARAISGDIRRPCTSVNKVYLCGQKGGAEGFDAVALTDDGRALRDIPNAGGASVRSEVMSMEVLKRAFGATLLATEMQAWYWPAHSPITDYVCKVNETVLGVSVTRAFHYLGSSKFSQADANRLIKKKLQGVLNSMKAIVYPKFERQILHVFCKAASVGEMVLQEYRKLGSALRGNTVLMLTVCEAEWIYTEQLVVPKKVVPVKTVDPRSQMKKQKKKKKKKKVRALPQRILRRLLFCGRCAASAARTIFKTVFAISSFLLLLLSAALLAALAFLRESLHAHLTQRKEEIGNGVPS